MAGAMERRMRERTAADEAVLAFDVGGANVKAADGAGFAHAEPCELWRQRSGLAAVLARIAAARRPRRIVATMTGEIADCYASRREGVADIVAALSAAARAGAGADGGGAAGRAGGHPDDSVGIDLGIYLVDGTIGSPAEALERPLEAAASNWHAVARLAGREAAGGRAFLVDVGSTTTDIVPLVDGRPAMLARDDVGRMATGELVYTGVERTPVAAIVRRLPWRGRLRPLAAERFADSLDAWLLLGGIDAAAAATADGGPATPEGARRRLARMVLADPDDVAVDEALAMADWCAEAQARQVCGALCRVAEGCGWRPDRVVVAGHGACLARRALGRTGWRVETVSLAARLGAEVSRVAPAHAVALVARGLLP